MPLSRRAAGREGAGGAQERAAVAQRLHMSGYFVAFVALWMVALTLQLTVPYFRKFP